MVGAGVFTDGYGNANTASATFSWTYDSVSPSVMITSADVNDGDSSSDSSIAVRLPHQNRLQALPVMMSVSQVARCQDSQALAVFTMPALLLQPGLPACSRCRFIRESNSASSVFSWTYEVAQADDGFVTQALGFLQETIIAEAQQQGRLIGASHQLIKTSVEHLIVEQTAPEYLFIWSAADPQSAATTVSAAHQMRRHPSTCR